MLHQLTLGPNAEQNMEQRGFQKLRGYGRPPLAAVKTVQIRIHGTKGCVGDEFDRTEEVVLRDTLLQPHVHEHPGLHRLLAAHTMIYDRFRLHTTGSGFFSILLTPARLLRRWSVAAVRRGEGLAAARGGWA